VSAVGAACGTWPSPVSAARVAAGSKPLASLRIAGARIHWLQGLPEENGRVAAMVSTPGASRPRLLTAAPLNVRTRVHEYGEGAYAVAGETLFFSNFADNLVYRQDADGVARPITQDSAQRHADFEHDAARRRLIAVREDHRGGSHEARNSLVAIACEGAADPVELAAGNDFYAAPRLSPDGGEVVFRRWAVADLLSTLMIRDLATGKERKLTVFDPGLGDELEHPDWSPDGRWIVYNTTGPCGGACERIERVPANDSKAKPVVLYQDAKGGAKPTYSPDGTSIVFGCRGGSLCRMNADGTNVAVLKENQGLEFNHYDWGVTPKAGA
jgi:hypothetical protein